MDKANVDAKLQKKVAKQKAGTARFGNVAPPKKEQPTGFMAFKVSKLKAILKQHDQPVGGNKAALVARIEAIPLHLDENDLVQAGEGDRSSNVSPEWGAAFAPPAPGSIVGLSFRDSSEVQYKVTGVNYSTKWHAWVASYCTEEEPKAECEHDLAEILKRLGLAVPDEADDITDDFDENGSVNGEPDAEYGGNP